MHKALIAAAFALLVVPPLSSSAHAQTLRKHRPLTAQMLQQVEAARSRQTSPATQVARHGTLRVTATFTKRSKFNLPVRCTADIIVIPLSETGGVPTASELSQSQPVTFNGRSGTCTLSMDYNWPSIDSHALLFVTLDVSTDATAFYKRGRLSNPVADVVTMGKDWTLNSNTPLPPANGLTVYDFGDLTL